MPVTIKLDWKLLKYKMAKYIDVDALNWYDDLLQEVDDTVDDALHVLDGFNASGKLDYNVYSKLHDIISNIYCSLKESQSG